MKIKKSKSFIEYFIVVMLFVFMNKNPNYGFNWSNDFAIFALLFISVLVFLYEMIIKKSRIILSVLIITLFIIGMFLMTILLNKQTYYSGELIFIILLVSSAFITHFFTRDRFLKVLYNVIVFLVIFSLISTYFLQPLAMQIGYGNIVYNEYDVPFFNFFFSFPKAWYGLQRNNGIFNEPGVFQFFILLAIVLNLYMNPKNKHHKIILIILLIAMISTFSSAGYISLIYFLIIYGLKRFKKLRLNNKVIFPITFFFIFSIIILTNNTVVQMIQRALVDKILEYDTSTIVRFETPIAVLISGFRNILFGNGFSGTYMYVLGQFNNIVDVTGTFFVYISALGFVSGILIIILFLLFCRQISNNKIDMLAIFGSLFLSAMSQNLVITIPLIILFYVPLMRTRKN